MVPASGRRIVGPPATQRPQDIKAPRRRPRDYSADRLAPDQQGGQAGDDAEHGESDRFGLRRPLDLIGHHRGDVEAVGRTRGQGRDDLPFHGGHGAGAAVEAQSDVG